MGATLLQQGIEGVQTPSPTFPSSHAAPRFTRLLKINYSFVCMLMAAYGTTKPPPAWCGPCLSPLTRTSLFPDAALVFIPGVKLVAA